MDNGNHKNIAETYYKIALGSSLEFA